MLSLLDPIRWTARLAVVLIVLTVPASAHAADCIDYADYLHSMGSVDVANNAYDVAIAGGHAYVTHNPYGLAVVDLAAPGATTVIADVSFPAGESEKPVSIVVAGHYAYVVLEDAERLDVIDISTPASPTIVGSIVVSGSPNDVDVSGAHAFVASEGGLDVVDISTPSSPTLVGFVDTGFSTGVDVSGSYAYVTADANRFRVVNVATPSAPSIVGSLLTGAHKVTVVGSIAYVSDQTFQDYALHVISVVSPSNPLPLGSLPLFDQPHEIIVAGGHAYIADLRWALQVVDVSSPSSPSLVGSVRTRGSSKALALDGEVAYVASGNEGLELVDISNPISPPTTAFADPTPYGFAVDGTLAYVGGTGRLVVLDVTVPDTPVVLATLDAGISFGGDVAAYGDYVYVCDESAGIRVVDVSAPGSPMVVQNVATTRPSQDVAAHDGLLYVGYYLTDIDPIVGYYVFDLTTPDDPQLVFDDPTDYPGGFAFPGGLVYVATDPLQVLDMTTPSSPVVVTTLDAGGRGDLQLIGDELYLANALGLQVIDVSDPASPVITGSVDLSGTQRAAVANGIAYMQRGYLGLWIVDIASGSIRGNVGPTTNSREDAAAIGDALYYSAPGGGLAVWPLQCAVVAVPEPGDAAHALMPALRPSPNPFTASAHLTFTVPVAGVVSLDVFDVTGRRVAGADLGWHGVGVHAYEYVPEGAVGNGVFFARIRTAGGESAPVRLVSLGDR